MGRFAFIDAENVGYLIPHRIHKLDKIFVFLGRGMSSSAYLDKLRLRGLSEPYYDRFYFTKIDNPVSPKNALDFCLTLYLGRMDAITDISTKFIVYSKDKGFDVPIERLRVFGRACERKHK